MLRFWLLLVGIVSGQMQPLLVPVEYTTARPLNFSPNDVRYFRFTTCHGTLFEPLHVTAQVVFPNSPWSIPAGSYLNFWVYSEEDGCVTPLCQNDLASSDPSVCAFTHTSKQTNLFVKIQAPPNTLPAQLTTLNVRSIPTPNEPPSVTKQASNFCPTDYEALRVALRTESYASVVNDPSHWLNWAQFELPVCNQFVTGFTYTAQAVSTKSAMASYLCNITSGAPPCNANLSFTRDSSGSALNRIGVKGPVTTPTFLAVAGWGKFSDSSNFMFEVTPN